MNPSAVTPPAARAPCRTPRRSAASRPAPRRRRLPWHRRVTEPDGPAALPAAGTAALHARQDQDRERLVQWLHDEVGGRLVQLRLAYGAWRAAAGAGGANGHGKGADFDALLAELCGTVRHLSVALAPPAWHGDLRQALQALAGDRGLCGPLRLQLALDGLPGDAALGLPERHRTVACRVVRELLLNVTKHAGARQVRVGATAAGGRLRITVRDDGGGLPPDATPGLGLRSVRAQLRPLGGELLLQSRPGRGTCATLLLPLPRRARRG